MKEVCIWKRKKKSSMIKLSVNILRNEDLSYPIYIGRGVLKVLEDEINRLSPTSLVVITDSNVYKLHWKFFEGKLKKIGIPYYLIVIPSGEKYKNRDTKEFIENRMLEDGIDRKGIVVALGGGVIGDIAGFVAATYHRGINFIQIPTTLLAMVDSSIGGKVAVDTPYGKNTIGAFHQPKAVIMDTTFLETLPEVQFKNGFVEILKHSLIKDREFYEFLVKNRVLIMHRDDIYMSEIIRRSCEIKKDVVEKDEKETGLRKILNFGHTVGHAIESFYNYRILHGLAVSVGIVVESLISFKLGILPEDEYKKVLELLRLFDLPVSFRDLGIHLNEKSISKIVELMKGDKKSLAKEIKMSLIKRIGEVIDSYVMTVEPSIIHSSLRDVSAL